MILFLSCSVQVKFLKKIRKKLRMLQQAMRFSYGINDLKPVFQIIPKRENVHKESDRGNIFIAEGDDPQFRLNQLLPAGWYMVELQMLFPTSSANARFYLDTGNGESEDLASGLPVRCGRMAKRLLHVPALARLRFDPMEKSGQFEIQHFRIVRVSQRMAMDRIEKKLRNPSNAIGSETSRISWGNKWLRYNQNFESASDNNTINYERWIHEVESLQIPTLAAQQAEISNWSFKPTISIVLPTFNTPEPLLRECLDSVVSQTYPYWELCIADDASTQLHVKELIAFYSSKEPRIRYVFREKNGHISECSNDALALASGEFIALLDHDDTLPIHALFMLVRTLQEKPYAQIIYSDEDKLDYEGRRCDPFFKPDWSPDLVFSQNYMAHLMVYRHQLLKEVGGFRKGFEGSQDYDLLLRCIAKVPSQTAIVHIPKVLYHWRMTDGSTAIGHMQKSYATNAAVKALQEHMDQFHPGVNIDVVRPGIYRHRWPLPVNPPLVSLIIPTRDGFEYLRTCIESILNKTTYKNYEILIIDNQSSCPKTLEYMRFLENNNSGRIRILKYDHPFNYSAINNFAAKCAKGDVLGLINNDVEVINEEWLSEMVSHAVREDIGCVGAKLYYPDGTIQHAGVVLGIGGVAGHSHKYFDGSSGGYFGKLWVIHNVSAVTGAVLLVKKSVYAQVHGLDDELKVAFNDVDFCIKVREAGYRNILTPYAELFHHESKTRGTEDNSEKKRRFANECLLMKNRWKEILMTDPFYNQNLTLVTENYSIGN